MNRLIAMAILGFVLVQEVDAQLRVEYVQKASASDKNDGWILFSLEGDTGPYDVVVTNAGGSSGVRRVVGLEERYNIAQLYSDTYTITSTDRYGCQTVDVVDLHPCEPLADDVQVVVEVVELPSGPRARDGVLEAVVLGDIDEEDYFLSWYGGVDDIALVRGLRRVTGLGPGTYNLLLQNGCDEISDVQFLKPECSEELKLTIGEIRHECGNRKNGGFEFEVEGIEGSTVDYLLNGDYIRKDFPRRIFFVPNVKANTYQFQVFDPNDHSRCSNVEAVTIRDVGPCDRRISEWPPQPSESEEEGMDSTMSAFGINQQSDARGKIVLYSNPTYSDLMVEWREEIGVRELQVLNGGGKRLLVQRVDGKGPQRIRLSTSELHPGIYYVLALGSEGIWVEKFIKM